MPNNLPSPNQILGNNSRTPNQPVENNSSLPNPEQVLGKSALKKKEVSQSTQDNGLASSVTSKTARKKPLESSVESYNWNGQIYVYRNNAWEETALFEGDMSIPQSQKSAFKKVTDRNKIKKLNYQFKKDVSLDPIDQVYSNYDEEKKDNEYRVKDGNWERKLPGSSSWNVITNEGSVSALNRRYNQSVKYTPELKLKKTEPKLEFADVNTSLVEKTEGKAVETLSKKYGKYGFTFEEDGFLTDYVTVYNKDKSKEITIGFDEKNPEEALKLKNFLEQNASKEYSSAYNKIKEKKNVTRDYENISAYDSEKMKKSKEKREKELSSYLDSEEYNNDFKSLSYDEMKDEVKDRISNIMRWRQTDPKMQGDLDKFYKSETYKIYKQKKKEEFGARDERIDLLYTELQTAKASGNKNAIKNINSKITAYLNDDIIQDQVKNYSMQLNDLDNAAKKLANDQKKYLQSVEDFNKRSELGQINQEEFDQTKKMLDDQAESLSTRADFLVSSGKSIQKNQRKLNVVAGKYVTEKSKAGGFFGGVVNSFVTGISKSLVEVPLTLVASSESSKKYDYNMLSPEEKQYYKDKGYSKEETKNILSNERIKDLKEQSRKALTDIIGSDLTTKEYIKSKDRGFFEKAIYGVSESAPAMLMGTGGYAASFAGLASQSYSSIEDEMLADPDFQTSSVEERAVVAVPYATLMGVLENYGLKNVVKGESFAGGIVKNILASSIKKMPKGASRDVLQSIMDKEVKNLIAKGSLKIVNGAIAEFETGATQSLVLDIGLKSLYNKLAQSGMTEEDIKKLSGGEMFATPDTLGEVASTVLEDGLAEAVGGATIGTFTTVASGLMNGNISLYNEEDLEYLKEISQDSNFKKIIVANLKTEMLKGSLTKSEAQERLSAMNELASVMESIPDGLTKVDQIDAVNMLSEKNRLTREIQGKDPALVTAQTERINEINEELKNISKNAVQKQTTGEVPVQPEATVGREMEEGKPQAEPQVVTEEGQAAAQEEVNIFEFNGKKYEVTNESTTDLETGNLVPIDLATQIREEGTLVETKPIEETVVVEPITKQEQKQNLVTQENVEELRSQQTTPVAQKIFTAAKLAMKALPGVKVYVHNTTTEFDQGIGQKSAEGSKGAYVDGEIHINLENGADVVTMLHESLHHGLVVKGVQSGAMLDLAKGLKSVVSDKGLRKRLDDFVSGYDASEQSEEYVAELGAIMAEAQQELSTTKFQQFKNLINKIAQKLGLPVVFTASANAKNAVDFMNSLTKSVRTGQEVYANDPGDGGEVGTFNIPKVKYQKAKSVSEDSRDFIREFVEDLDIREFNGQKFVTNMYDYTNAGETDLGNGFKINMLGGKNYVPLMMSLNGKKIGDVSNLAAFNTKAQAETFIRNAQMGGAELFAPHSGTLSNSWQFQQHTFAELFSLVLDKGILTPSQLISTFNDAIKSNKDNKKEFAVFAKKYGESIKNFDSFKSNPKKIIELLDIKNNYSPNLRKALNNAISANKIFQEAIGVKNKEEFYNRIMDPLNQGMKGGEIMNVVKFDPNTFEIVQTKESDIDHHPSFGWTLLAKINGIYQPTNLYKSSNVTETYTKYNKDGAEISRKAEEPKFEQKNVSSSAGAIPKVAEFTETSKPKFQKAAPNGKPSNLNDKQWEQVRTPEFKKWFGDWENDPKNASKIVDENGEPLVVYHGSLGEFDEFESRMLGSRTRAKSAEMGFFFSDNKQVADSYVYYGQLQNPNIDDLKPIIYGMTREQLGDFQSTVLNQFDDSESYSDEDLEYLKDDIFSAVERDAEQHFLDSLKYIEKAEKFIKSRNINKEFSAYPKGYIYDSFLNIRNPKQQNLEGDVFDSTYTLDIPKNNDGVILDNAIDSVSFEEKDGGIESKVVIAFEPNQIKSATENVGTFSAETRNIKFQKANLTTDKDAKPGYEAALNALNETEQQREQWRKNNKVNQKQKRNPLVEQAVKDYFNEEITQEEYLETVAKNQPIKPFKQVPALPTLEEITNALDSNKVATGIIGLTKNLEDGEKVASRLDIPAYEDFDTWVVSVHDGNKEGKSIAYGQTAVLKNVDFKTFPGPAIRIAMGTQSKSTIARMFGNWVNEDPESVHARAKELMNDPAWTQVGMNPFRYSWFYDKADGMPLASADEVVQVGALVLAKNAKKVSPSDPMFETKSGKGGKIKFQKANTQQEAIQKAKEEYTLSVEQKGNPHQQGVDAALNELRKSDWYNTADDTQRENAERELKEFFGERLKKAPSAAKILGKPKAKKVAIKDEYKAMITQIKLEAKAAREAKADLNSKRKMLAAAISGMVKTGKVKASQAAVLVKRVSNLNLDNPVMVERFTNYAQRVFERADYQQRLDDAFAIRKSIRKLLKTENQAEVSGMAKAFTKIDPSLVEDIDVYIEMAEKVKNAVKPSRVKGLDVVLKEAANIAEISEYTNEEIARQEEIQIKELLAVHDYLEDISKDMSLKEIQDIINLLKEKPEEQVDKESKVMEFLKNRFEFMAGIIETMFKTGVDPMTGEEIEFDENQKDLMKRVLKIDLNEMSTREAVKIVEGLDNFLNNQITSGLESAVNSYEGDTNVKSLVARGKAAKPLRLFGTKKGGRFYSEQLFSLPNLMEKMFGGVTNSIDIMRKMGLLDVINGVNKAIRKHNDIIDNYSKQAFAKGKDFMDAKNIYERGMLSELMRTVSGTAAEMKAEFENRVKILKESIDLLIEDGNSKEKKMGELYKEIYDKLNIDSMDMDVINANASKENLEAVNWWINEWSKYRSELFDVSLSVYNTMLSADLNYTPRVLKKLSSKNKGLDENLINQNGAFAVSLNNIDTNKTGVLMETTGKRPSDRYINLDFDNNNSKALKAALTDINTAAAIRKVDGFINSKAFKKLVPESEDRTVLERRISTYIKRAKGKNIVPRDTVEYLNKFVNYVTALGVGKALAGLNQTVMQTVPVILNTFANAGRFDFVDSDFNNWLNESGMPISNRGFESQSTINSIDKKLEAKGQTTDQILKGIANANQWWLKQLLVKPDVWVARSSFKSYYLQNLNRRGISTDIDWKNHKIDKEAAEYAQIMVDRQQNISDPMLAGEFLASDDAWVQITRKIFIPFASFILNQKARMYNDLSVAFSKTASSEDKSIARWSLAGLSAELLAYQMIGFGIRRFYDMIAAWLLGDEDDEETKRKKLINATKYPLKSIVNDIVSPLPILDDFVTIGLNQALAQYPWMNSKEIKDAVKERNRILELKGEDPMDSKAEAEYIEKIKEEALYQVYRDDNERKYGMIGIAGETYKEVGEISKLYATGEFTDEYQGREIKKKLLEADRKDVGIAVLPMIAYSTGLVTKDVGSIGRNYIKRIKKKAITEKQYERYDAVQKELGRNLKSWEIELVKGKKESETAISEIEFIDRRGGLTERQGREYLKVMKAIGEPSVIDLIKIQEGQTANQILK